MVAASVRASEPEVDGVEGSFRRVVVRGAGDPATAPASGHPKRWIVRQEDGEAWVR